MSTAVLKPGSRVITLGRAEFRAACMRLMAIAQTKMRPDLIVGIPTGGMHVAAAMLNAAPGIPVYAITCRRASTGHKRARGLKSLVSALPRPVTDRLRVLEHAMLTRHKPARPKEESALDHRELDLLAAAIPAAGKPASILVVDDAVDTGATLLTVMKAVAARAPANAVIRSAVITQTTANPLLSADYALYNQLCRFPWSLDAIAANQS